VPVAAGLHLDLGRLPATLTVSADPFNCLGAFSDAAAAQCGELRFMSTDDSLLRAFKTPSLRAVVQRPPYMHAGQFADLETVVAHYNHAPWSPLGLTELHPLELTDDEVAALVAFLKAL
jgi:cytochrome c peroxidase